MIDLNGKRVDLAQLTTELTAAGVAFRGLGTSGDGNDVMLFTYNADGETVDLPAGAAAVVAAHTAPRPMVDFAGQQRIETRVTTTGTTPAELFRRPLAPLTGYAAMVHLVGIDSGNGNMRYIRSTIAVKRLANGASLVPVTGGALAGVLADHRDGAAGTWTITPSVAGNDFVIVVAGAAARTVNWFCRVEVDSFTPGGQ